MDFSRRSLITGLAALIAAPAIVRAGSLMPVRQMIETIEPDGELYRVTSVVTYNGGFMDVILGRNGVLDAGRFTTSWSNPNVAEFGLNVGDFIRISST